jgi:sugar transferase (PEP-CTERM/EpsH1 system associated)
MTRMPAPPWRGDQVRAFHHLRILARRHHITCATLVTRPPSEAERAAAEALGVRLAVVPLGLAGALPALGRVVLGDRRPLQVLLFLRRRALARVAALLARQRFDVVHAQLVRTAPYLPPPAGPPVVLDLIDVLSENFARRARRERGPLAPVMAWEATRLRRFERELLGRTARALVVSDAERAALGDAPNVAVVTNGVDAESFAYRDGARPPARILFAGNLGYFPNVDAARWLAEEIFPRVRAARPDAELRLVGARPAHAVRQLAERPGVTLAAAVPEMAPEVWGATVAVVPMRAGTGVQNKVLEAMAAGTPVVTTPGVARALHVRDGEDLLIADGAEALAAATIALLDDPARARAMAASARAVIEARYTWERSADGVEAAWEAATRG